MYDSPEERPVSRARSALKKQYFFRTFLTQLGSNQVNSERSEPMINLRAAN